MKKIFCLMYFILITTFVLFGYTSSSAMVAMPPKGGGGSTTPEASSVMLLDKSVLDLKPTKSQFDSISTKYKDSSKIFYSNISKEYEVKIIHYEAPYEGYYSIYTTGNGLDTVGAIYEKKNVVWVTTRYEFLQTDDDGCEISKNNNFSMVQHFEKFEDYYICVRGYSTNVGNYTLHIEPNEDKILTGASDKWTANKEPLSTIFTKTHIISKQYLNEQEIILLYWSLSPASAGTSNDGISLDDIANEYEDNVSNALDMAGLVIGGLLCTANPVISISASVLLFIVSNEYEHCSMDSWEMMELLADECGCTHDVSSGKWSANKSLCITEYWVENSFGTFYDYDSTSSFLSTGEKYYSGNWN